jgi:hypothetical protein
MCGPNSEKRHKDTIMRQVGILTALLVFMLAGEANSQTRTIAFGGSGAVLGQNSYVFRAVAYSKIQIRLDPGLLTKGKPLYLALYGPNGFRICEPTRSGNAIEISTCALPADGLYTIIARSEGISELFLACLTGNCASSRE